MVYEKIQELAPKDDNQRTLKAQALGIVQDLGQTRWLQYEQATSSVPLPLLVI
jgi:hypothetical protein